MIPDLSSQTINALGFWVNYLGLDKALTWADAIKDPVERIAYRELFVRLWKIGHPKE